MGDDKAFFEELLDRVFFAPIGAIAELKKNFPEVVAQGRDRVESGVRVAGDIARSIIGSVAERIDQVTVASPEHGPEKEPDQGEPGPFVPSADADLPIADYGSLSTATIVARLGDLNRSEREKIQKFEASHRGRRTVLGRLRQLEDGSLNG